MKLILTKIFLLLFSVATAQSLKVEVKDEYGRLLDNSTKVELWFQSKNQKVTKRLNNRGYVEFTNPYAAYMKSPLIQITIMRDGYQELNQPITWNGEGDLFLPLIIKETREVLVTKEDLKEVEGRIQEDIDEATAILIAHSENNFSNELDDQQDKVDVAALEAVIDELGLEQQKVRNLQDELIDRDIDLNKVKGDLEDVKLKYKITKEEFERLQIVEAKYAELVYDISIELDECRCLAWDKNYIELYFKVKSGQNGKPVPKTYNFDVTILVGEKNKQSKKERILTFASGSVEFNHRYYPDDNGLVKVQLIFEDNEIEKKEGFKLNNYKIYFYNKKLYGYRDKHKISMGEVVILNLKNECGKRTPLKIISQRA